MCKTLEEVHEITKKNIGILTEKRILAIDKGELAIHGIWQEIIEKSAMKIAEKKDIKKIVDIDMGYLKKKYGGYPRVIITLAIIKIIANVFPEKTFEERKSLTDTLTILTQDFMEKDYTERFLKAIEEHMDMPFNTCERCGRCCLEMGVQTCDYWDLWKWFIHGRKDILRYACVYLSNDQPREINIISGKYLKLSDFFHYDFINGDLWITEDDDEKFRCPFLRKKRNKDIYICKIQDLKPSACEEYPIHGPCLKKKEKKDSGGKNE